LGGDGSMGILMEFVGMIRRRMGLRGRRSCR
jgi:hypothetical protein